MAARGVGSRFSHDRSGIAAVEFALVLPFLMTAWLGMEQFSEYATADARTLMAAQSVANLTAQITPGQTNAFTDIAAAATQIMQLSSTSTALTVDVAGVAYDSGGHPTLTGGWRCTTTGGPAPDASVPLAMATGLGSGTQVVVMVNVKYAFQPSISFGFLGPAIQAALGTQTLSERSFAMPRLTQTTPLSTSPCSS